MRRLCTACVIVLCCGPCGRAGLSSAERTDLLPIRGRVQSVHLYGLSNARPVILSSGDGGWIHLGPHVARLLAAHGCFVIGFAVRAYLTSFTSGTSTLGIDDEPADELGWRWTDSIIYLTHGVPNEPTFSAASLVGRVSPLPLALLHSTHDEFAPLADAQRMLGLGGQPQRLWIVPASDHRFSDNLSEFDQRLLEAVDWVTENEPR